MLSFELNKRVKNPWSLEGIKKVFKLIYKHTKINGEVEVNIVGDKEMKSLNFHYRGLNKTTDVLSFAWQEDKIIKSSYLGQIYISYPQIAKQAKELRIDSEEEFVRMLAHGFLHIIGHDHIEKKEAKVMFGIQENIVDDFLNN
ncbi:MAG: rRNA maturation RNase YbeY [Candidatus Magasanikbacteria bacterium]|nr:rRNA maturation RNase YbeY [Candidatus Magasanikbacteria bacterium]